MPEKLLFLPELNSRVDEAYLPESVRSSYQQLVQGFVQPYLAQNGIALKPISPYKNNQPGPDQVTLIPLYLNLFEEAQTASRGRTPVFNQLNQRASTDGYWFFNIFKLKSVNGQGQSKRDLGAGAKQLISGGFELDIEAALELSAINDMAELSGSDWQRSPYQSTFDQQQQLILERIQRLTDQQFSRYRP